MFSVSKSNVPDVIEYIKNQLEHHAKQTFDDEYVSLLKLHGVDYDEQYLFDLIQSSLRDEDHFYRRSVG